MTERLEEIRSEFRFHAKACPCDYCYLLDLLAEAQAENERHARGLRFIIERTEEGGHNGECPEFCWPCLCWALAQVALAPEGQEGEG